MPEIRRVLHISDVHCSFDNLVRVLRARAKEVDGIVLSGDLECDGKFIEVLRGAGKPVFAVTGNMDDHYIGRLLDEAGLSVENRVISYGSYIIAGISGRDPTTSISQVANKLKEYQGNKVLIVAHHPPKGVVDKAFIGVHAGLYEARGLIEELKPLVYFCGHIHEARGYGFLGSTLVVNAGPLKKGYYAIVDLRELSVEMLKL